MKQSGCFLPKINFRDNAGIFIVATLTLGHSKKQQNGGGRRARTGGLTASIQILEG